MAKAIPPESIQTEDIDLYKECEEFELSTRSLYAYGEKKVEQTIHAITEKTSSYINVMRNLSISELII